MQLLDALRLLLAGAVLATLVPAPATAMDVGVSGTKLLIETNDRVARTPRLRFVVRGDPGVAKGPRAPQGEAAGLDGTLEIFYSDAPETAHWVWPLPAPWGSNGPESALFKNRDAPGGPTSVRWARVRAGRSIHVFARGLEGSTLPADPPSSDGGITVQLTIHNANDGSTHRMCTRFATGDGSTVSLRETRTGLQLLARDGVPTACRIDIPLAHPDECEFLNDVECLLPYPSSRFEIPADTATGVRLDIPAIGLPDVNGPPLPVETANDFDGWSPGVQILMHFPQGVDPALSNASRLLPPGCCGQPPGPPWIDTRTYDERSLDADSPTVLLNADTGERILHFIEPDARADGPERQVVFLRPGRILDPGQRYIVAVRNLVSPTGEDVVAEPAFAALRDGTPTTVSAIEERRPGMEALFDRLESHGVGRDDLILAFDFTTRSQEQLTEHILSMRDQAYAWLDEVEATPGAMPFTVDDVAERNCERADPPRFWRRIEGTYQAPLFLTGDLAGDSVQFINLDDDGTPLQNGFTNAEFTITIPCSVLDPAVGGFPLLVGHGLFGTGRAFVNDVTDLGNQLPPWRGIVGGTDWRGLSSPDLAWVGNHVIGIGVSQLHNFQALPDRLRQGMLNTLVLARLMKRGLFNRHDAFQTPAGTGAFPGPSDEMFYLGGSLGGIMGTYLSGLTPDILRFVIEVGAVNFSCMLQRATPFRPFDLLLPGVGVEDPMEFAGVLAAGHELWVSADPTSVIHHVTSNPLPGSGDPKRILMSTAFLDHQVSNTCSEIAARTMGLPNLIGSIMQEIPGIPDMPGPLDSAYVLTDIGEIDILNPAHVASVPPLANLTATGGCDPHGRRSSTLASVLQFREFLQPGGQIVNLCDGICDGATPDEQPANACVP